MEPLDYSIFPEQTVTPATFGQRLGALILDNIILSVAGFIIVIITSDYNNAFSVDFLTYGKFDYAHPLPSILKLLMSWLYFTLQESGNSQATIGKKALGIKVTNMNGGRLTFGQATGRHFAKWLSAILLLFGYFMMLWDAKSQTLHDRLAGALVVRS